MDPESIKKGERITRGPIVTVFFLLCVGGLAFAPTAEAFEVSGGVALGGALAGTKPRLAVSPHISISWRRDNGLLFTIHEMCSLLPAINAHGIGVDNQVSVALGYASADFNFSLGPSLSIYSMSACNVTTCGRAVGLSPGAQAQANVYFSGPFGASVSASVDWIVGNAGVFLGGMTGMIVAGPVLRWSAK
jgi:hypothetical protein